MLTKLFRWLGFSQKTQKSKKTKKKHQRTSLHGLHRVVIPRADHPISRKNISQSALKVLYRLEDHGFEAYLVGGGVRDLLLGQHPKDFDIATNATPEQVYRLFKNSRMIGRRFKLVHVFFGAHLVEVATFRAPPLEADAYTSHSQHSQHGVIVRDNLYGSLEEDVWRRDFTVNALYYTVSDFSIIDYVDGLQDLKDRCLRIIGDARLRYREDPVRMLRAIRFAAKLDFSIHPDTAKPIVELADLVHHVAPARLFEECLKLFFTGYAVKTFALLKEYGLLASLFPILNSLLKNTNNRLVETFITHALQKTDTRIEADQPVSIPFLIATLLWPAVQVKAEEYALKPDVTTREAYWEAMDWALKEQQKWVAIPKRIAQMTHDLWIMQQRLSKQNVQRAHTLFAHINFRAAYDFLMLRAEAGEKEVAPMATWWTVYIAADEGARLKMTKEESLRLLKNGKDGKKPSKGKKKRERNEEKKE